MIATPRPGSDRFRLLALIVANPGELDAAAIAGVLYPLPALPPPEPLKWSPSANKATLAAWKESIQGRHLAREAERAANVERVLTDIGRLASIGLVEKTNARMPMLSPWFLAKSGTDAEALDSALSPERCDFLEVEEPKKGGKKKPARVAAPTPVEDRAEMLALIAEVRILPRRAVDLVSVVGIQREVPERNVWRAWTRLIEAGVIVPPSYRWATEAGRALVQGA